MTQNQEALTSLALDFADHARACLVACRESRVLEDAEAHMRQALAAMRSCKSFAAKADTVYAEKAARRADLSLGYCEAHISRLMFG